MVEDKVLMQWLITTVVPIIFSGGGFYAIFKNSTASMEHRLTKLESDTRFNRRTNDAQDVRLNKHDEEQKTMREMIVQIKNLSDDMRELKQDFKEIKEKL